ncbi:nucleotidyltransferase domain-containing protein [Paenibacillus mucilaginosus]|uniref:YcgL n=1 Tax=Paenibacillus mucilaginosus (strain KNP414) TaxID=1036673 RepID=F8FM33_PAEMK|nr:nucleotidyltransferase domain-containing protein [Paenibacillus mucilaginosus]AEI45659.1 YcgL [Paenibacillus mucilaginosus KNP414]MCG7215146.1 nucleotidyltransferase domain-containing protein [Paenibacillus mucilaginosus]WDM27056.1 nucleotidyltransferase domain-containing protein [Paenibacillus mucilaginosus]
MTNIREEIITQLHRIEEEENVRILYACESGSRAWGFPSQDSDYDVRFLYLRPLDWYLSIDEGRDVIERPISDRLDLSGWDLRKALRLFRKSNPPLLEWLQSPMPYLEKYTTAEQIRRISPLTFSPKSCIYHYLNMAKGNFREYLQGDQVKIKKYFYVLRPLLACSWIEKYGTMAPMEFDVLVERLIPADSELYTAVQTLLARKKAGDELDYEPKVGPINVYLEEQIAYFEQAAVLQPSGGGSKDVGLDALFRGALREVWGE